MKLITGLRRLERMIAELHAAALSKDIDLDLARRTCKRLAAEVEALKLENTRLHAEMRMWREQADNYDD